MEKIHSKKIIFCGSDAIALPMLDYLYDVTRISLCGILSQPDRRSGRGRQLQSNPVKDWAKQKGLEIRTPASPGINEINWIKEIGADLILVMAYGHILSQELLKSTPLGCYNLHASLLPKYRGASPIESALANGERLTGVTLMRMVRRMDAGPILGQENIPITNKDTATSLRKRLADGCVTLIDGYLENLISGDVRERRQIESEVTYCRKLNKEDAHLDFSLDAMILECRIRAFQVWPGSVFFLNGSALRVGNCKVSRDKGLNPGEIAVEKNEMIIGTGKGSLQIFELQKPGGKMLPIADFLRGYDLKNHTQIKFSTSRPLVSKKFH